MDKFKGSLIEVKNRDEDLYDFISTLRWLCYDVRSWEIIVQNGIIFYFYLLEFSWLKNGFVAVGGWTSNNSSKIAPCFYQQLCETATIVSDEHVFKTYCKKYISHAAPIKNHYISLREILELMSLNYNEITKFINKIGLYVRKFLKGSTKMKRIEKRDNTNVTVILYEYSQFDTIRDLILIWIKENKFIDIC
jgi:hypothetical protein